jgi:hypothetical protein
MMVSTMILDARTTAGMINRSVHGDSVENEQMPLQQWNHRREL